MPESLFVNFAITILAALALGLAAGLVKTRADLADLRLHMAEHFARNGDITKVETGLEGLRTELKEVLKAVYQIQAQLSASGSHGVG